MVRVDKVVPNIAFDKDQLLNIEVITFEKLFQKLNQATTHSPFEVHKIEFYLIMIVTDSAYSHYVDFISYSITPGSAIFIAKNQVHHFSRELEHASGYCLIFNSLFTDKHQFLSGDLKLKRLFNYHIEAPIITAEEFGDENIVGLAELLFMEYNYPSDFGKTEILSNLLQVLFLKSERAKEVQAISDVKTHWLEIFSDFRNMLEKGYVESRNSRAYAKRLFISYKFLNDIVKSFSGQTVKTFIDEFVTIEIKRYLVSTSKTVKEISYETGFDEPANMVKFFKKHTQLTPLKFRQLK